MELTGLDQSMDDRFEALTAYAKNHMQADGVLWSCSAFGSCIEKAANIHSTIPVLKPNEAMQEQIVSPENGGASLVLSMFEPTLPSIERELFQLAQAKNVPLELELAFVEDALAAKNGGELDKSANMIADRAVELWARRVEREPERGTWACHKSHATTNHTTTYRAF